MAESLQNAVMLKALVEAVPTAVESIGFAPQEEVYWGNRESVDICYEPASESASERLSQERKHAEEEVQEALSALTSVVLNNNSPNAPLIAPHFKFMGEELTVAQRLEKQFRSASKFAFLAKWYKEHAVPIEANKGLREIAVERLHINDSVLQEVVTAWRTKLLPTKVHAKAITMSCQALKKSTSFAMP
ncbi:unnamed protein product [Sympodiomycopsis kandeliae]